MAGRRLRGALVGHRDRGDAPARSSARTSRSRRARSSPPSSSPTATAARSALMPQKRNPYALAVIRTQAGHRRRRPRRRADDAAHRLRPHGPLPPAERERPAARSTRRSPSRGSRPRWSAALTIDAARWERAARDGLHAAADVADVLAVEAGLDYRTAHHVVGPGRARPGRRGARARRPHARAPVSRRRGLDGAPGGRSPPRALADALDPAACVAARLQTGSAAPAEVASMIRECREVIDAARALSAEARARASAAETSLRARARDLSR